VFESKDYATWASRATVHVMSYYIAPEDDAAEPTKEVEREGEKVNVLLAYPDFTKLDMEILRRGIDTKLVFPEKTPWAGVVSPDGTTVLAEKKGSASAKEYRELYDAEAKKLGPSMSREEWRAVSALLAKAMAAEVSERWKEAVAAAREAHERTREASTALRTRVAGQVEGLHAVRERLVEAAKASKDEAARAKELARVEAEFAGLPAVEAVPVPDAPKDEGK
jgi:hypothetical protein